VNEGNERDANVLSVRFANAFIGHTRNVGQSIRIKDKAYKFKALNMQNMQTA